MVERLDPQSLQATLDRVPAWHLRQDGTAIERCWTLADFAEAFALVGRIAALAEAADHHPEIAFGWGRVMVTLTTHDAGGLSALDVHLAERIDRETA